MALRYFFLGVLIFLPFLLANSNAQESEPIPITLSHTMDKIKFDGRWSFETEWKASTLSEFFYNDTEVILRSAHQGEFIYILVDPVTERSLDYMLDTAMVCFNSKYDNSEKHDDYCFIAVLGESGGTTLQRSDLKFEQIPNHEQFIAVGNSSDNNDRYTAIPHPSYEFKIPIELLGRSDKYSFFFSMYDADKTKFYNWPTNLTRSDLSSIPESSYWGEIISPDKSLPEFHMLPIVFVSSLILIIYLTKISSNMKKTFGTT